MSEEVFAGMTWCNRHRVGSREGERCDECEWEERDREERRAALTRALTAQAWAVACALLDCWARPHIRDVFEAQAVASLPAPAELAEELLR